MLNRFKIVSLFLIVVGLMGCASIHKISDTYNKIYYEDGIDKREAIAIAQKKLLFLEKNKEYMVSLPNIDDKRTYWRVIFSSLYGNKLGYIVVIDKKSGKVIDNYEITDEIDFAI